MVSYVGSAVEGILHFEVMELHVGRYIHVHVSAVECSGGNAVGNPHLSLG